MFSGIRIRLRRLEIYFSRRHNVLFTLFAGYICFLAVFSLFGERGLLKSLRVWHESQRLEAEIRSLASENADLHRQVDLFRNDRRTIEQYARRELHLAGEGEIQYIFR